MQKFILFFVLSLLLVVFGAFLVNSYSLQKEYFGLKKDVVEVEKETDSTANIPQSIYKNYSKADYDEAISENRTIVLFFTSNWCEDCSKQNQINIDTFKEMDTKGILGLTIHILDSETTTETDAIAKKFDVTKENTFVILNQFGAVGVKHVGGFSKGELTANILKVGDIK